MSALVAAAGSVAQPRRRRVRVLASSWTVLGVFASVALGAAWIAPADPLDQDLRNALQAPLSSWSHVLGTDELGRDVLSRLVYGGRSVLLISLVAVAAAMAVGVALGALAGTAGGLLDAVASRVAEVQLSIPGLVFALLVLALFGTDLVNLTLVLAIEGWPLHFRIARAHALVARRQGAAEAARLAGGRTWYVATRHVAPGLAPLLVTTAALSLATAVMVASAMGFLGFGVQPPNPDWGAMISAGIPQLDDAWWLSVFPGLCLVALLGAMQRSSDGLADRTTIAWRDLT